jgi:hypothetical protein
MRVLATVFLTFAVGACASSTSTSGTGGLNLPPSTTATATIQGTGAATGVRTTNEASSARLNASLPVDLAWTRIQAAYATLGIKVTTLDQSTRTIGNTALKARRKIGDVSLINALNCGMSGTGPNSESYELTLTFQSRVLPAPEGVIVETFISGTGQNPLTNTGNLVPCYSMGVLEKRIVALMTAK